MRIGYARVSTDEQTTASQIDALTVHGCERIYQEQKSGKNTDRAELESCLKALREGDTLVVWRLDRLGRSLVDLIRIVQDLETRSIGFTSLTEQIDTTNPTGKLIFHLFGALSDWAVPSSPKLPFAGPPEAHHFCDEHPSFSSGQALNRKPH